MASKMVEDKKKKTAGSSEEVEVAGISSGMRTLETLLRVVPMGLCLAALVVTLKNSQNNDYGSVSYSNIGAFKYLAYANGVCAAYSLISAFYTAIPRSPTLSRAWMVFFFDQVLTYVILAAGTVSVEILYLAYNGDAEVTWSKECGVFDKFCHTATKSVGITFGAVVCFVLLSIISSFRLFSTYEAPISFAGNKGVEAAVTPSLQA
ncbi:CASP-like protein 2A1 [Typha latifolia]|uniref:CASP-like protein 2A1 n=1 Tax=Typha latifolia TaxID=4733 RepID=UPI003C2CAAEC